MENTAKTSVYLKNLIEPGIVAREFSVESKTKEKSNAQRGTYRLTDNFFRFWYAFGFANLSQLEDGDVRDVYEYAIAPVLYEFASFTFEDICREFVRELQKKNALPFRYTKMGRWTGKTTVRDTNKEFSGKYKVDRIFADKHGECTARREMINYLREGDEVIVEDIYDICDSV